jgi:hypothetical protein
VVQPSIGESVARSARDASFKGHLLRPLSLFGSLVALSACAEDARPQFIQDDSDPRQAEAGLPAGGKQEADDGTKPRNRGDSETADPDSDADDDSNDAPGSDDDTTARDDDANGAAGEDAGAGSGTPSSGDPDASVSDGDPEPGMGADDPVLCGGNACDMGRVCCPAQLPCADTCVPDCRAGGACPSDLECSEASGVCEPPGGGMPSDTGGPQPNSTVPPDGSMPGPGPTGSTPGPGPTGMPGSGGAGGGGNGPPNGPNTGGSSGTSGSEDPQCSAPSGDGSAEVTITKGAAQNSLWQGNNVALDCDTLVIGDPTVSEGAALAGKVHVYTWTGTEWDNQQNIALSDPITIDLLGSSVAVEGDTLVAGAPHRDACDKPDCTGAVGMAYIFTRSEGVWTQAKELTSASQHYLALFGMNVAISGTTIAVAAPGQRVPTVNDDGSTSTKNQGGMIELWTKGPMNWNYATEIVAPDLQSGDYTGTGLALSGSNMILGAPGNLDGSSARPGRVFVYTGSGSTWTHQITLMADDGVGGDGFGRGVAYASDLVVVGAPQHDLAGAGDAGAALQEAGAVYVYTGSGASLEQAQVLYAPDAAAGAQFGYAVAAPSSTRIVVGAPGQKALYVFDEVGGTWTHTATHTACNAVEGGGSLATYGDLALTASGTTTRGSWVVDLADPNTSCIE